mgnify:CR=1 FL=1
MSKGIIIYKSKYGATKKYAEWLAVDTKYDLIEVSKAKIKQVSQYQNIVLCGAIYASGIGGLSFLKNNFTSLSNNNLAIFCVGASPYDENAFNAIKTHNLKDNLQDIPLFYGRGAWDESKMKIIDRTLCKLLQKVVAKKDPSTYEPWETALTNAIGKTCDWTDKAYLEPLIALISKW